MGNNLTEKQSENQTKQSAFVIDPRFEPASSNIQYQHPDWKPQFHQETPRGPSQPIPTQYPSFKSTPTLQRWKAIPAFLLGAVLFFSGVDLYRVAKRFLLEIHPEYLKRRSRSSVFIYLAFPIIAFLSVLISAMNCFFLNPLTILFQKTEDPLESILTGLDLPEATPIDVSVEIKMGIVQRSYKIDDKATTDMIQNAFEQSTYYRLATSTAFFMALSIAVFSALLFGSMGIFSFGLEVIPAVGSLILANSQTPLISSMVAVAAAPVASFICAGLYTGGLELLDNIPSCELPNFKIEVPPLMEKPRERTQTEAHESPHQPPDTQYQPDLPIPAPVGKNRY